MELLDPSCFLGLSRVEQYRMILIAAGIENPCALTEEQFYREWIGKLTPDVCTLGTLDDLQLAVYTALYG